MAPNENNRPVRSKNIRKYKKRAAAEGQKWTDNLGEIRKRRKARVHDLKMKYRLNREELEEARQSWVLRRHMKDTMVPLHNIEYKAFRHLERIDKLHDPAYIPADISIDKYLGGELEEVRRELIEHRFQISRKLTYNAVRVAFFYSFRQWRSFEPYFVHPRVFYRLYTEMVRVGKDLSALQAAHMAAMEELMEDNGVFTFREIFCLAWYECSTEEIPKMQPKQVFALKAQMEGQAAVSVARPMKRSFQEYRDTSKVVMQAEERDEAVEEDRTQAHIKRLEAISDWKSRPKMLAQQAKEDAELKIVYAQQGFFNPAPNIDVSDITKAFGSLATNEDEVAVNFEFTTATVIIRQGEGVRVVFQKQSFAEVVPKDPGLMELSQELMVTKTAYQDLMKICKDDKEQKTKIDKIADSFMTGMSFGS